MLQGLRNKIMSMIRLGVSLSTDDSNPIQLTKAKWLGVSSQKVETHVPYGTFGKPASGTQLLLLNKRGNESTTVAIPSDSINRIKKDTKSGEYGIGNHITGANIYFKENGDAVVEVPDGDTLVEIAPLKIIGLGEEGTNPLAGVVTGECLDPVTGVPFPDKSSAVYARKI